MSYPSPALSPSISISLPHRTPVVSCRRPMRLRVRRRKDTAGVLIPPLLHSFTPSLRPLLFTKQKNAPIPTAQNAGGVLQAVYALARETPEGYCRCLYTALHSLIHPVPSSHAPQSPSACRSERRRCPVGDLCARA